MAFYASVTTLRNLVKPQSLAMSRRFSPRVLTRITVSILLCIVLGYHLLWQPTYQQLRSLQMEKIYWEQVLYRGVPSNITMIPTMDQLPDMIERCRSEFAKEGVELVSLNVERFGERREAGTELSLDYSLVRLHLRGNWPEIITALQVLEEAKQETSIHVQEAMLDKEGGEILLQIYFCTGGENRNLLK